MINYDNNDGGLGFWEVLCLILITLRLTDQIDWWWGWCFAPILGKYVLGFLIILLGWGIEVWKERGRR